MTKRINKTLKISPQVLLNLMTDVLNTSTSFKYIDGVQPFFMSYANKKYYVYIKNVSSAYFKDRTTTTRAQLPKKKIFDKIKKSSYPFIFLGYDCINDVIICWNFHVAKKRLNEANSVSFYSRIYYQENVKFGEFQQKKLKNGDTPIFFKRKNLITFFENIDSFFTNSELISPIKIVNKRTNKPNKLLEINEPELIKIIKPYIISGRNLSALEEIGKFYGDKYPDMKILDWMNLIKKLSKDLLFFKSKNH